MTRPATHPSYTKSKASLALGIISVAFGFTFFVPIVGMVLASMARSTEPDNAMRKWGFGLCLLMLIGWIVVGFVMIAAGGFAALLGSSAG